MRFLVGMLLENIPTTVFIFTPRNSYGSNIFRKISNHTSRKAW